MFYGVIFFFDIIQDLYAYFQMLFNEILRDVFVRFGLLLIHLDKNKRTMFSLVPISILKQNIPILYVIILQPVILQALQIV